MEEVAQLQALLSSHQSFPFFSVCVCGAKNNHANKISTKQPFFYHLIKVTHTQHLQFVATLSTVNKKNHILLQLNLFNVLYWHKNTQWTDACTAGLKF